MLWDTASDMVKAVNPVAILEQQSPDDTIRKYACLPDLPEAQFKEQLKMLSELAPRYPVSHHWDSSEPKLLAIEAASLEGDPAMVGGDGMARWQNENWCARKGMSGNPPQVLAFIAQCAWLA